ncbi:hypothetical protein ACS0TY_011361 [Phlomoides rotata]
MGGVGAGNWAPPPSSSSINSTPSIKQVLPLAVADHQPKLMYPARPVTVRASSNQSSPMKKMKPRLMSISSSDGKWRGKWNSDYIFSLQDLQLHHLLDDEAADTSVFINLCIQKVVIPPQFSYIILHQSTKSCWAWAVSGWKDCNMFHDKMLQLLLPLLETD